MAKSTRDYDMMISKTALGYDVYVNGERAYIVHIEGVPYGSKHVVYETNDVGDNYVKRTFRSEGKAIAYITGRILEIETVLE